MRGACVYFRVSTHVCVCVCFHVCSFPHLFVIWHGRGDETHSLYGVSVTEGAKAILQGNTIRGCKDAGVSLSGRGSWARLSANELLANGQHGTWDPQIVTKPCTHSPLLRDIPHSYLHPAHKPHFYLHPAHKHPPKYPISLTKRLVWLLSRINDHESLLHEYRSLLHNHGSLCMFQGLLLQVDHSAVMRACAPSGCGMWLIASNVTRA